VTSERIQRQIDRLLDEAEAGITALEWHVVRDRVTAVLALDGINQDARTYLASAQKALAKATDQLETSSGDASSLLEPSSFANGRYDVRRLA
jgi:hypothetical protein